ncbi:hypothetical protein CW734_00515 (plasmid) [Planococcus sp. MB-3u-03]|uniref:hypothetical protein n=1 Tax=Planococcus sp. MB-3u-03 TaxID=2058136 RepID=UPI000C31C3A4|nr:hypothetical protein [Planococcus sp. MB-3u-03]AUD12394.1 hypothetical protein CW734_00515 [Planococcus sp. MB-3u-03]
MIDDLKAMSTDLGLSNTGDEYKIIAELFTYKFLNDKLLYDFENRDDKMKALIYLLILLILIRQNERRTLD